MVGGDFLSNKYHRWYDALMQKARDRGRPDGYFEKHHIVPRCMGGSDNESNIACLTYREHFLAHWLLIKFTKEPALRKMFFALKMMGHKDNQAKGMTSWQYAIGKAATRKPFSDDHRNKISARGKGRKKSEEHKKKIGEANRGRECPPRTRAAVADANRHRKHTEEANQRRRVFIKNFFQTEEGKKHKERMVQGCVKTWTGRRHTEESKELISKARKANSSSYPRCPVTGRWLPKPK